MMRAPLTRADLLRQATAILGRGWAEEIEDAMNIINVASGSAGPRSARDADGRNLREKAKQALKVYQNALDNLITARARLWRDAEQFSWVMAATSTHNDADWQRVLNARASRQAIADDFDAALAHQCAAVAKLKARPAATKYDTRARAAVREAAELLLRAGKPIVAERKLDWWRLSAILYGDPKHDLYHVLREYWRHPPEPRNGREGNLYSLVVGPGKVRRPNRAKN